MKNRRKKRSAIVPTVVFAVVVGAACVPNLGGCGDDSGQLTVAQQCFTCDDMPIGFDVAARDFALSVADIAFHD
jgi:hypothetical protein